MSWLYSVLLTVLKAVGDFLRGLLRDRKAISDAEARGAAEERERALREAQRQEDEARRAAEEAASRPAAEDDGWRRD